MKIQEVMRKRIQAGKHLGSAWDLIAKQMEKELKIGEEVVVQSYKEHPAVQKIVEAFRNAGHKIEIQECFTNSASLAQFDQRIKYVEGQAMDDHSILYDHAWNCYGDFFFDLTAELALQKSLEGYLALGIFDGALTPTFMA